MNVREFEEFFAFMRPKLVRYARRRLAADAAGEVAIQALQTLWSKQLEAPRDEGEHRQLQSLSYRLVEGHISNTLRSAKRQRRILAALVDQHPTSKQAEVDTAERVVAAADDGLPEIVERLSLTDREVLLLLIEGYKVAEIAIILDCTPAAASMRLKRAKDNLRLLIGRGRTHESGRQ